MSRTVTAVIADDHAIVRAGLAAALSDPRLIHGICITVLAEATNGLEAIELIKLHRPDLLLLDVSMPFASGAEIVADLMRWSPDTRIVVLTAVTSPGLLAGLVESGIHGLFSKASDNSELFAAIPLILRGARRVESSLVEIVRGAPTSVSLTHRERQVLTMIISGRSNAEIATLMGISPRTAEKHRANLMTKLGVRSLPELMPRALSDGLIEQHSL